MTRTVTRGKFDKVKEAADLKAYAEAHLERVGRGYVCPHCGSGTGPKKTPAFSISPDGIHWKCFSCDTSGDVFDLAGECHGLTDPMERLIEVADFFHVDVEEDDLSYRPKADKDQTPAKPAVDYTAGRAEEARYITRCAFQGSQEARKYLEARGFKRGISSKVGYDKDRQRVIIPWKGCSWYHIDRATFEGAAHKYEKPKKELVGPQPLYNPDAAKAKAFFVVEGVFDAMAVEECGFEAVAMCTAYMSHENADELAQAVKRAASDSVAIIMNDMDERGDEAEPKNVSSLKALGVRCLPSSGFELVRQYKDAAEWYQADPDALEAYLKACYKNAVAWAEAERKKEFDESLEALRVLSPEKVAFNIFDGKESHEPIPTGLPTLDHALGGGLPRGLVCLGAVSSLGKTTLAVQIADQIAASRRPVLFVTIEQAAPELVAKSLSRFVYERAHVYMSTDEILTTSKREKKPDSYNDALMTALNAYADEVAPHLSIQEAERRPSVADVMKAATLLRAKYKRPPVIFIDYLQLLASSNDRYTDKQAVDDNVTQLRQLARELETTVFVISSLNRTSYTAGVEMDAFKESGGIEYSSDLLIGLQPRGKYESEEKGKAAKAAMREVKSELAPELEITILKNRNGIVPPRPIPVRFIKSAQLFTDEGAYSEYRFGED